MNLTNVIIVSAPSGSGKSTLIGKLLEKVPELDFSVSYTTRQARGQEKNGQSYFFVSQEEFRTMLDRDEFLEWAVVYGKDYYGTPRRFLDQARAAGHDLLLDIDVQGAAQVKKNVPDAVAIFILPPSRQELEKRLRSRGLDQVQAIERRLKQAGTEIRGYVNYDYVLINKDLEKASECLNSIVLAERWRRRLAAASGQGRKPDAETQRWMATAASCRKEAVDAEMKPILETFNG